MIYFLIITYKHFTIYFLKQNANPKLLWIRLISLLPIFLELMN